MNTKRFVAAAAITAMVGFGSLAGVGVYLVHRVESRAPATSIAHDDGMIQQDVQPWADPEPPFPLTCAHPAYCQLGVDLVCTIVYVMLNAGTAEADIVKALRPQHDEITAADFAECQGFLHYWEQPATV